MSRPDDDQRKLLETLLENEQLTARLQAELQRGVGYTQKSLNTTRAAMDLVRQAVISGEGAKKLTTTYQSLNDQTRAATQEMRESMWAYGTGTAQGSSTASSVALAVYFTQQSPPVQLRPPVK